MHGSWVLSFEQSLLTSAATVFREVGAAIDEIVWGLFIIKLTKTCAEMEYCGKGFVLSMYEENIIVCHRTAGSGICVPGRS